MYGNILTNSYNMQTNELLLENELLNNGYLNKSDEDKKILDVTKYIYKNMYQRLFY